MIKQLIPQGYCLRCNGCCRFKQADSIWLPSLLKEEPQVETICRKVSGLGENNFICSFFSLETNQCKIYSRRPFECQLYPFLIHRKAKDVFLAVHLQCPYIDEILKNQKFKKYTRYLTDLLDSPTYRDILRNNPQIIKEYPGVLNLAKLELML